MALRRKATFQPYDMDTAIGTNNSGVLMFGYSLEDTDTVSSIISGGDDGGTDAPVFNAQDSVLWNNVRDAFRAEISQMYQQLRTSGAWNAREIIKRAQDHQGQWCEAIYNEDQNYKHLIPLINPVTEDENGNLIRTDRYLTMLQGSKEEQRKWWLTNRFRYMDSKYVTGDAVNSVISMRVFNSGTLTLTAATDLYLAVRFGGGSTPILQRRNANTPANFTYTAETGVTEMETWIYSADLITDVGDLSVFYGNEFDFSRATRLQRLKIGDSSPTYSNANLKALDVRNSALLEYIDVRNCPNLAITVNLEGSPRLKEAYFDGTSITGCDLADGASIEKLHLPSTITTLTLINLNKLTEFVCPDFSNVSRLMITNMDSDVVDPLEILADIPANSQVNIQGLYFEASDGAEIESFLDLLDTMRGVSREKNASGEWMYHDYDTAQVSGTIHTASLTGAQIASYNQRYPYLRIVADHTISILTYMTYDGSSIVDTETVYDGGNGTKTNNITRPADKRYTYTPNGWSKIANGSPDANALVNVVTDRTVYAAYDAIGQKYRVRFYNGSTLMKTVNDVLYGGTAEPPTEIPVYSADPENFSFTGWSPSNVNIDGNTDCYAQYRDNRSVVVKYLTGTLEEYNSDSNTKLATQAFYNLSSLTSITAPATVVESNIAPNCSKLKTVDLTSSEPVTIATDAFNGRSNLESVFIRSTSVSTLSATSAFNGTPIAVGLGVIYVHSSLISDYKSASNWSTYADKIYPIDAYPVTDFSTISDSWEDIVKADANKYSVGSTKKLNVNGKDIYMQIVAKNTDVLADGSGTANYTWMAKGFYDTHYMNPSPNTTKNGWLASDMRKWLRETVLPTIDSTVVSNMKEVTKTYYDVTTSSTLSTTDTVFIPSAREMFGESSYENSGITYTNYFKTNSQRIKYNMSSKSASPWWLRSAYSATAFRYVNSNGSVNSYNASNAYGVALCFCT